MGLFLMLLQMAWRRHLRRQDQDWRPQRLHKVPTGVQPLFECRAQDCHWPLRSVFSTPLVNKYIWSQIHTSSGSNLLDTPKICAEPIKQKHPKITYADLYQVAQLWPWTIYLFTQLIHTVPWLIVLCFINQLAGVVAVEVTGGPTIDFVPGRKVS